MGERPAGVLETELDQRVIGIDRTTLLSSARRIAIAGGPAAR